MPHLALLQRVPHQLSYQWTFGGNPIVDATNASLTVSNAQVSNAGIYAAVVTNSIGRATSSNATLTVNLPPANVQIGSNNVPGGGLITLPVKLVANGNENALSFSINFDPAKLTYNGTAPGSGAGNATWFANEWQVASGRLGLALALDTGATFAAGTQEIFAVTFTAAVVTNAQLASVNFGDTPTTRELSDAPGNALPATYSSGAVSIAAVDLEGDVSPRPGGRMNPCR